MTHGSLFSGIGGFDLAAQWIGWENIFQIEINEFCQKVLTKNFPNVKKYKDIKKFDGTKYMGTIDVISGGFPCQPYSIAGKRKGKEDERHLWPEMFRAIREIQPSYIVAENVCGIINWNGGLVFEQVQADLEAESYEVQSVILPACAKNAPHRRDRVWFIAYSNKFNSRFISRKYTNKSETYSKIVNNGSKSVTPNTKKKRFQEWNEKQIQNKTYSAIERYNSFSYWKDFPTQSPICIGNDGFPNRLDGISFPKWRRESIKALGNAIVPQIAYEIFKCIDIINKKPNKTL